MIISTSSKQNIMNLKVAKTVTDTDDNVWNVYRVYRNQPGFVEIHIGKERAERGIKMPTSTYEDWVSGYIRVQVVRSQGSIGLKI